MDLGGPNKRLPQSWNRYAYALANPIKYVDPWGLDPILGVNNRTPPPAKPGTRYSGEIGDTILNSSARWRGAARVADDEDDVHARHCNPLIGRFLSVDLLDGSPS